MSWKEIFDYRPTVLTKTETIKDLSLIAGFDGVVQFDDTYVEYLKNFIDIKDGAYIYEFGCGCGTFIKLLKDKRYALYDGCDISENALKIARYLSDFGNFELIKEDQLPDVQLMYDYVLIHSVLQYMTITNAIKVIDLLLKCCNTRTYILDIYDRETYKSPEEIEEDNRVKSPFKSNKRHTLYTKELFLSLASANKKAITIRNSMYPGRFNVEIF
jgi:SAM-dependent methyltransferase